ncbi:hypothetical protein PV396_37380 [Streptomyces sp. ME02-8801-2C]|uniref:hypothetical protein n=1 Tax=Streptomyces sp. ME02-8801-2C TaxID=3028680 RepID=UPI0029A829B3|nr:hypothetical protein [Streptomyces sp. ME02-8801-2C]MDX3457561.1 hypothetical protein [Streptomyces sp. ME02-8801-2C]
MTADRPDNRPDSGASETLHDVLFSKAISVTRLVDPDPAPVDKLADQVYAARVREGLDRGYGELYVHQSATEWLKGYTRSRRADILLLLEGRGISVPDADRDRVAACNDLGTLTRWFRRAITAASTAEMLA